VAVRMTISADPRVDAYAKLLVERCLNVQPGMQVLIRTTHLAAPAVLALQREIARRGAHPILRIGFMMWPTNPAWAAEAPEELLGELSEIDRFASDHMDARITMDAPENTRDGTELSPERFRLVKQAEHHFYVRTMASEIPWVSCAYPTEGLAQDAGLTLEQFEDVLYGACLIDWDAEGERLRRYAGRFDAAEEVRIVGAGTDLRLSLAGRTGEVDEGHTNMPGGEFFYSPLEDSAEGVIEFSEFPSSYQGHEFAGIRLVFRDGVVVDASATKNEAALHEMLDRDEGARRIGELGIGCNPGLTRPMNHVLFDEKMDGSIHLALGQSYEKVGGTNESSIHWDIVKDLRTDGRIELDGEPVQENGRWLI
jgi:aminopeptidase